MKNYKARHSKHNIDTRITILLIIKKKLNIFINIDIDVGFYHTDPNMEQFYRNISAT